MSPETRSAASPTTAHFDRLHYEQALRDGNTILLASYTLDAGVRDLRRYARHQLHPLTTTFAEEVAVMRSDAHDVLEHSLKRGEGDLNEYYRLVSLASTLEQRIFSPLIFEDEHAYEPRRKLIDGIYGIYGTILSQALDHFKSCVRDIECRELRGVIQELTTSALINRPERKRHLALTSDTSDDLYRKIDIDYWRRLERSAAYEHIPIQVKSQLRSYDDEQSVAPKNGIVITATDFDNHSYDSFPISHLIVHELGISSTDPLTEAEKSQLDDAQNKLFAVIEQKNNALKNRIN